MSAATASPHFLVHAVMKTAARPCLAGNHVIDHALLGFVEENGLMALVSEIPSTVSSDSVFADAEASAKIAVAHHALLTSLSAHMDLAPIRLGAVYAGEEAVKLMLRGSSVDFTAALENISGAAEFAMKLTPIEGRTTTPTAAPVVDGRSYLQRRSIAAAEQRNTAEHARTMASNIFTTVSSAARAYVFASPRRNATADHEKRLLDAALLVARDKITDFGKIVLVAQEQADAQGFQLSVTGPLPPYSFVNSHQQSGTGV